MADTSIADILQQLFGGALSGGAPVPSEDQAMPARTPPPGGVPVGAGNPSGPTVNLNDILRKAFSGAEDNSPPVRTPHALPPTEQPQDDPALNQPPGVGPAPVPAAPPAAAPPPARGIGSDRIAAPPPNLTPIPGRVI